MAVFQNVSGKLKALALTAGVAVGAAACGDEGQQPYQAPQSEERFPFQPGSVLNTEEQVQDVGQMWGVVKTDVSAANMPASRDDKDNFLRPDILEQAAADLHAGRTDTPAVNAGLEVMRKFAVHVVRDDVWRKTGQEPSDVVVTVNAEEMYKMVRVFRQGFGCYKIWHNQPLSSWESIVVIHPGLPQTRTPNTGETVPNNLPQVLADHAGVPDQRWSAPHDPEIYKTLFNAMGAWTCDKPPPVTSVEVLKRAAQALNFAISLRAQGKGGIVFPALNHDSGTSWLVDLTPLASASYAAGAGKNSQVWSVLAALDLIRMTRFAQAGLNNDQMKDLARGLQPLGLTPEQQAAINQVRDTFSRDNVTDSEWGHALLSLTILSGQTPPGIEDPVFAWTRKNYIAPRMKVAERHGLPEGVLSP
ncbi:MAG: hypothetical protein M3O22_03925 [Pseudomonadota bacterium]|nr:hypothetical protein [Pseudomonadota bacterium]